MALPLAGGLLLAGAGSYLAGRLQDMMNERETERETARRQSAISQFLGNAPQYELPPDQAGPQIQGSGLIGALQDPRQQEMARAFGGLLAIPGYEDVGKQGLLNLQRTAMNQGQGADPFFQVIQTNEGLKRFNARTGEVQDITGQSGVALMPPAFDPSLQGAVSAARSGGSTAGKARAQSAIELPQVLANTEQMLSTIDKAITHPGRELATGTSSVFASPFGVTVPGTDVADFRTLIDQLQGKTFLEAYESLKGGGQITEVEGKKAEQAIARLNTAQSDEAFLEALKELRDIAEAGRERALKKAGVDAPASPASGGWSIQRVD